MSDRPVTMGLRLNRVRGGHVDISVFLGRNEGARGHCGEVVMRAEEWAEIRTTIPMGELSLDIIPSQEGADEALEEATA